MSDAQQPADVAFADIESALAVRSDERSGATAPRALTATIVAVGPADRVAGAADPLRQLAESGGVRAISIAHGSATGTHARVSPSFVALEGVPPAFVDNAVAAIRLSSLPTLVWWRGGPMDVFDRVVDLADRVVLDVDEPDDLWAHVVTILDRTAFSDLRWTRLTRWRSLMAQFFDMPSIASAASAFTRLRIEGADRPTGRLFAAWLKTSLGWQDSVRDRVRRQPPGCADGGDHATRRRHRAATVRGRQPAMRRDDGNGARTDRHVTGCLARRSGPRQPACRGVADPVAGRGVRARPPRQRDLLSTRFSPGVDRGRW